MGHFLSNPQNVRDGLHILMKIGFAMSVSGFALYVWQRRNKGSR